MIRVTTRGSFKNVDAFLQRMKKREHFKVLEKYGELGVTALKDATPVDSSETANSWYYKITDKRGYYAVAWHNSHVDNGIPIVILLHYGHGTRTGGYVQGQDFINPAIKPIFDQMATDMWKVVTK